MHQTKILFYFLIALLGNYSLAQTQKELNKMSYDQLKTAFFENENNVEKQKLYAKEYLVRAKEDKDQSKIARGYYLYSLINQKEKKIIYFDSIINNTKTSKTDKTFPIVAYLEKGYELENQLKFKEAINCYLKAEEFSLKRNIDYYYLSKFAISSIKSEKMGDVKESMPIMKECFDYFKNKKNDPNYSFDYQNSLFAMADNYKSLNQLDSASYYNKLGYIDSKKTNNEILHYLFILNEGANQTLKKNYKAAIDSIDIALPKLKKMTGIGNNILASYYYYGKAYEGLNNRVKAVENFNRVDSIYQKSKLITPEFTDGYHYLIEYYKKTGNTKKQLYYINTLMTIDSTFQVNYKDLSKKLHKEYDAPHLIKEKELIINTLKSNSKKSIYVSYSLILLSILLLVFGIREYILRQKSLKRFETLMQDPQDAEKNIINYVTTNNEDIGINEDVINEILKQLDIFEKNNDFLNPNITLRTVAEKFNTNNKYVSKIINKYRGKNFVQYINDLRIAFIIEELKTNIKWQNYSISALAEEIGFNSAESFSTAFYKFSNIKPSFYIKELKKLNH